MLLGLLATAFGCAPSSDSGSASRLMFVRGGVVVPPDWSADGVLTVTADGTAEQLTGRRLADGRLFFELTWQPRKR